MVEVPEVVIERLPLYLRALRQLQEEGLEVVSSQQLGERLQMTPAQIRKDLSYFGRFGKQGRGYNVRQLAQVLRTILGLDREWRVAVVGVGRLGRAIISYPGFAPEGFHIVAAFDVDPSLVGRVLDGVEVRPVEEMDTVLPRQGVHIGIVAVPASHAQEVIDRLVACGVRGILNYAPITPQVPEGVTVRTMDPVLVLQAMTYHLKRRVSPGLRVG